MVDRVEQFENESIRLGCPDFADAVIGRETAEAERLGTLSLVPGMPTEIRLATEKQTALAYMAKPVMDQVERALREEQARRPKTKPRSCGSQPAHESLLNRRLCSISYPAHPQNAAPGFVGGSVYEQGVDSDHETRVLK
jgi:hypothetical protein